MSADPPQTAMVLAAGLGTRMRPLTNDRPKPLVEVLERPLIDHVLDRLEAAGVTRTVVNVHYLADMLERHLADRAAPEIIISDERELLRDTGGGIAWALPKLGADAFYLANADSLWVEGPVRLLDQLAQGWDPARMDGLLALAPVTTSVGYDGDGDFNLDQEGRIARPESEPAPFVYTGTGILSAELFRDCPDGAFSLNLLFDRAIAAGRLHGLRLDGVWIHVGTPDAVDAAEWALAASSA